MNFEDGAMEGVELVQRDGRFFVVVREAGAAREHGPLTQQEAIDLHKREDARLRGKVRH